jgi:hypothetical protein
MMLLTYHKFGGNGNGVVDYEDDRAERIKDIDNSSHKVIKRRLLSMSIFMAVVLPLVFFMRQGKVEGVTGVH